MCVGPSPVVGRAVLQPDSREAQSAATPANSVFANHVFILSTLSDNEHFPGTLLMKTLVKGAEWAV
jgi:hypothetical protein